MTIEAGEPELGWPEGCRERIMGRFADDALHRAHDIAGLVALVKYAAHYEDGDSEEGHREILDAVQIALEKVAL